MGTYRIKPLPFGRIPKPGGSLEITTVIGGYYLENKSGIFEVSAETEEYLDTRGYCEYVDNKICKGTYEECRAAIEAHYMERLLPALLKV